MLLSPRKRGWDCHSFLSLVLKTDYSDLCISLCIYLWWHCSEGRAWLEEVDHWALTLRFQSLALHFVLLFPDYGCNVTSCFEFPQPGLLHYDGLCSLELWAEITPPLGCFLSDKWLLCVSDLAQIRCGQQWLHISCWTLRECQWEVTRQWRVGWLGRCVTYKHIFI